ncbi:MAG: hypothetical protein A2928_03245 [Candidatus Taylorbacteria bacterium RIFCSPLOWO2_01_FULL_45_15b]|uniref:Uncharacterized protein n=1 Tax=Candidatus Taylorbacteria bacterium RIFCSPLOWO2_01_FULL_45_15b TaxID=1802319 RepID=A0A1G2NFX5_9BACT|nr:MAG: hypothetical protein A2928_03245 [Candidatus Taylorbacteria bacterium RIFCSPLOWO2_01_FULL_45_15b]
MTESATNILLVATRKISRSLAARSADRPAHCLARLLGITAPCDFPRMPSSRLAPCLTKYIRFAHYFVDLGGIGYLYFSTKKSNSPASHRRAPACDSSRVSQ